MASAESRGKTVGIVFAVIFLLAGGGMAGYFGSQIEQAQGQLDEAERSKDQAKQELATAEKNLAELRYLIGGTREGSDDADLQRRLDEARKFPRLSEERRQAKGSSVSIQAALDYLHQEIQSVDQANSGLVSTKSEEEAALKAARADFDQRIQTEETQQASLQRELAQEQATLLAKIDEQDGVIAQQLDRAQRYDEELDDKAQERQQQKMRLDTILAGLEGIREQLEEQRSRRDQIEFVAADAEITSVIEGGEYAYLDVGYSDGLRVGQRFGIYSRDVAGNVQNLPKAQLEVVSIDGEDRAIGKIMYPRVGPDNIVPAPRPVDPILPGDYVYTPIWSPQDPESVAIVGDIDLDGDGKPDNDEFESMITEAGGKIDAKYDLQKDRPRGEIDVDTDWLVVGDVPEGVDPAKAEAFKQEARDRGISLVSVQNFLNYLAFQSTPRSRALNERVVPELRVVVRNRRNDPSGNRERVSTRPVPTGRFRQPPAEPARFYDMNRPAPPARFYDFGAVPRTSSRLINSSANP